MLLGQDDDKGGDYFLLEAPGRRRRRRGRGQDQLQGAVASTQHDSIGAAGHDVRLALRAEVLHGEAQLSVSREQV